MCYTYVNVLVCTVDRTAGEVCSGVVNKCLNQRTKTKELGMAVLMTYIEIEKQDIVQVIIKLLLRLQFPSYSADIFIVML